MNLIDKTLVTLCGFFALVATCIASGVLLQAWSNTQTDQATKPMAQSLMVAPIKTSSVDGGDLLSKSVAEAAGETGMSKDTDRKQASSYSKNNR